MRDLLAALGLVLAIEGLLFAAVPGRARRALREAAETPEATLRRVGIASAVVGVVIVWIARRLLA